MAFSKTALVLVVAAAFAANAVAQHHRSAHKYSYALVTKDGTSEMGDWNDNDFDASLKKPGPDRLYVRKQGRAYVITDPETLRQIKKAFEPMEAIGRKQSALGDQQSKLGDAQTKIGDKQSELGERMGQLGEQMGKLAENDSADSREKQRELQSQMDALQKQMDELNRQMDEPSKKQDALGRQQEELGHQMEKAAAAAEQKVDKIIDQAFAAGLAKGI